MKKIILWGFGDVESDISDFIEISGCKITTHFLERPKKPGQIAFGDLHSGQFLQKPLKENSINFRAPKQIRKKIINDFLADYLVFNARQTMLIGCDFACTKRDSFSDLNLLYFLIDYFYDKISKDDAEAVIFSSMPHEGADFVLYQVAKALKKRVMICYQSIFDNRFFVLSAIEDLGDVVGSNKGMFRPIDLKIKKEFEKKLQYMDIVADAKQHYDRVFPKTNVTPKDIFRIIFKSIRGKSDWIRSFCVNKAHSILRLSYLNNYIATLQEVTSQEVDFDKKFVYFPLHLQPEVTTTPLGGKYYDQISAIEDLSEILPEDVLIYVKENPKQIETMRPREFFARMMRIKNVVLVPITTNTYDLTKHCQFVATVTGTAGWEAITGGKPVLTFGNAWYNNLPGVFKYNDSIKFEDIASCRINHDVLQAKFDDFSTRLAEGYVDKEFINYSDKPYNRNENHQNILRAINKFLG